MLLAGGSAAQAPDAEPESELQGILDDITAAHGGEAALRSTTQFQGRLEITSAGSEDDKVTVGLDIRFMTPKAIRYKVDEGERRVERGRDTRGSWTRLSRDEPPVSLGGRDYEGDRRELNKHTSLAAQLLRFLDPAAIAAMLNEPGITRDRLGSQDCLMISGTADSFPIYSKGGDQLQVTLQLWIDARSSRLTAVQAFPMAADGEPEAEGELIYMSKHRMLDGVLVPSALRFYRVVRAEGSEEGPSERRQAIVDVRLIQLDLDPELDNQAFDRRRPW